jgi:methionyl-tRNA formyltransferase
MNNDLRIVFMGTPEFAVSSLDRLLSARYNIIAVVTAPDKPAGRGLTLHQSDVKKYALSKGLNILQPEKLRDPDFIEELTSLKPDLQIVVAFRMLPEVIWKLPSLGTFNLHASLLPQYRGAAPINWAIINGEKETGVTTFFLNDKIDAGNIILSEAVQISPDENAGELHDRLMLSGADLVVRTVQAIQQNSYKTTEQEKLTIDKIKSAPKIFKQDCKIDWSRTNEDVYNFIRGLSPYPGAFTEIFSEDGKKFTIKIFRSSKTIQESKTSAGSVVTDGRSYLAIATTDGLIRIEEIQLTGKKIMRIDEFLRGFPINETYRASLL